MHELRYYIFDIIEFTISFNQRNLILIRIPNSSSLTLVPGLKIVDFDELNCFMDFALSENYEGSIIRNPNGLYEMKRSKNLIKYKNFIDAEYKVVGYTQGKGKDLNSVIWICEILGETFNVRPIGTKAKRVELFNNGKFYIGKMLTVRYQELTKRGIPRFTVGIGFRDESDLPLTENISVKNNYPIPYE